MPKQQIKISNVMVVQPPKRETIDIQKYIRSLRSADRGKRRQLYDVYEGIIKDPVLGESVRKRVRKITNGGIRFMADNDEVEEINDLIESPNFRELLETILRTRFYGKSIVELDFTDEYHGFRGTLLERRNYDTKKKVILKNYFDDDGWPYEDDEFLLNIGKDDDLGQLMESAPYAIFKRNGGADYAEFCELWGIPILKALYDPDDENGRKEMEETMKKRGAAGSIVASKNSDIDSISSESKGAVHREFLDWLDQQILIGTIGQTMTSKDGSSESQSRVHAEVEDDINEDDQAYVLEVLNHQLLWRLEKRGFPVGNGRFMYPERDNLTLKEKVEIAVIIDNNTTAGVNEDYWFELTGIPKGDRKEPKQRPFQFPGMTGFSNNNLKPWDSKVLAEDRNFYERLKDFFGGAPR